MPKSNYENESTTFLHEIKPSMWTNYVNALQDGVTGITGLSWDAADFATLSHLLSTALQSKTSVNMLRDAACFFLGEDMGYEWIGVTQLSFYKWTQRQRTTYLDDLTTLSRSLRGVEGQLS